MPWADVATAFERHKIKKNQEVASGQTKGHADGAKTFGEEGGMGTAGEDTIPRVTRQQPEDNVSSERQASEALTTNTVRVEASSADGQTRVVKTVTTKAVSAQSKQPASIRHTSPLRRASHQRVPPKTASPVRATASPVRATAFTLWGNAQRLETNAQKQHANVPENPTTIRGDQDAYTHTNAYKHTASSVSQAHAEDQCGGLDGTDKSSSLVNRSVTPFCLLFKSG